MRKFNAVLGVLLIALVIIHAAQGAYLLISGGQKVAQVWLMLPRILITVMCIHAVIGIILAVKSAVAQKKSGAKYTKENRMLTIRRVSGYAVMFTVMAHAALFTMKSDHTLPYFGVPQLLLMIIFAASLSVHIITNIRASSVGMGMSDRKRYLIYIAVVTTVIMLCSCAGFFMYYGRYYA